MARSTEQSSRRQALTSLGAGAAVALSVPLAFLVVVSFGPPGLAGPNAGLWVGFAPWSTLLALVATIVSVLVVGSRNGLVGESLCGAAVVTLGAHTLVTLQLLSVGWRQEEWVNPWSIPRLLSGTDAPDLSTVYESDADGDLAMLVWAPPPSTRPASVMVYVHGGGWVSGHPSGRAAQMRWFAEQGWLVVAPEYCSRARLVTCGTRHPSRSAARWCGRHGTPRAGGRPGAAGAGR